MHNQGIAAKVAAGRRHVKPQLCADHVWQQPGTTFAYVRAGVQSPIHVREFSPRRFASFRASYPRHHSSEHSTQCLASSLTKEIVSEIFVVSQFHYSSNYFAGAMHGA